MAILAESCSGIYTVLTMNPRQNDWLVCCQAILFAETYGLIVPQGFISLRDSDLACRDTRADQDIRDSWLPQRWYGRYVQSRAQTRYELTLPDGVMAVGVVNLNCSLLLWKNYVSDYFRPMYRFSCLLQTGEVQEPKLLPLYH